MLQKAAALTYGVVRMALKNGFQANQVKLVAPGRCASGFSTNKFNSTAPLCAVPVDLRTSRRSRGKDSTAPQSPIGQGLGSAVMSRLPLDSLVRQVPSSRLVTTPTQKLKRASLRPDHHDPSAPSRNETRARLPHFFPADVFLFHYFLPSALPYVALFPNFLPLPVDSPSVLTAPNLSPALCTTVQPWRLSRFSSLRRWLR